MRNTSVDAWSLPDQILDGLCDIARDSLKADKVYVMLYNAANVQIIAECRAKDHMIAKRFPRELLNRDSKFDVKTLGNRNAPPRHLLTGSCDFTNLIADNESAGVVMVGFDQPQKRLTAVEKEIVRRVARTAISHLTREALLMRSARDFLDIVDQSKL